MHGQRWPVVGTLVCLSLALLALPPAAAQMPRRTPFTLAILRRDGVLTPFAAYDGQWKAPWPVPGQKLDMPFSAAAIPKSWWRDKQPITDWKLIPFASGRSDARTAHVTGVNYFRAGCLQGVGLVTDYKPAILPPPPRVFPYPKDALAYSGDVTIDPIEVVGPTDGIVASLIKELPGEITPKEELAIALITSHRWEHTYSEAERKATPVQLEALYRVPKGLDGRNLYYYEAVKRYFLPKGKTQATEEPHCDLVTFASGWFTLTPQGLIADLNAKVVISSCDYLQARIMLPLGTVTIDGERLWIVQWSNPMMETYEILKPSKAAALQQMVLVSQTFGGGCPVKEEN
jgi:hypothetical protein